MSIITLDNFQHEVATASVTTPRWLVELDFGSTLYFSTLDEITLKEKVYKEGEINLKSLSPKKATIELWNENYQYTQNAINGVYFLKKVRVYWAYPYGKEFPKYVEDGYIEEGYYIYPDVVRTKLQFSGYVVGAQVSGENLILECDRTYGKKFPKVRLRKPFANHLPENGKVIRFKSSSYRIND